MNKVPIDQATIEVNEWLDYKKISDKRREDNKESIDSLVESICDGTLEFDGSAHTIKQNLKIPFESGLKELVYKSRITVKDINQHMKGVSVSDIDSRVVAYVAALTNTAKGIILNLDTEDYKVGQSIAIFFI